MMKIVVLIIFCFLMPPSQAEVDNRIHKTDIKAKLSQHIFAALRVGIEECKRRHYDINIGGVVIGKNSENYVLDFGIDAPESSIRGSELGTSIVIVVNIKTLKIVKVYYPK